MKLKLAANVAVGAAAGVAAPGLAGAAGAWPKASGALRRAERMKREGSFFMRVIGNRARLCAANSSIRKGVFC